MLPCFSPLRLLSDILLYILRPGRPLKQGVLALGTATSSLLDFQPAVCLDDSLLQSPGRAAFPSSPDKKAATPPAEQYLQDVDEATRGRFKHLHTSFPSVPPAVILSALSISKGKLSFAKDVRILLS